MSNHAPGFRSFLRVLDDFQKSNSLCPCALDKSSLGIGRVNQIDPLVSVSRVVVNS